MFASGGSISYDEKSNTYTLKADLAYIPKEYRFQVSQWIGKTEEILSWPLAFSLSFMCLFEIFCREYLRRKRPDVQIH